MNPDIASRIGFRGLVRSDHSFVLDSFGRHMRDEIDSIGLLGRGDVAVHVDWLAREARGNGARWAVAALASDPNRIVGWACALGGELVFCYVRSAFRGWGVGSDLATLLVDAVPMRLLYWTRDAQRIQERGIALEWAWQSFRAIDSQLTKGAA